MDRRLGGGKSLVALSPRRLRRSSSVRRPPRLPQPVHAIHWLLPSRAGRSFTLGASPVAVSALVSTHSGPGMAPTAARVRPWSPLATSGDCFSGRHSPALRTGSRSSTPAATLIRHFFTGSSPVTSRPGLPSATSGTSRWRPTSRQNCGAISAAASSVSVLPERGAVPAATIFSWPVAGRLQKAVQGTRHLPLV